LTIIAIVVAIGMVTSGISNNIVFADKGGIPNFHAGDNPIKHCTDTPTSTLYIVQSKPPSSIIGI
jgi:hypothetical protein